MKLMKTQDAVGQVLCHDITRIIRGVTKDAVFRKGHVIRPEDIPVLLSVGKDNIYIWEKDENMLHENEAAEILRDIAMGENMRPSGPKEGKIDLYAECDGLFMADTELMYRLNSAGRMMIATIPSGTPVKKGDKLAGTRVIPLIIEKEAMEQAKALVGDKPLLNLVPIKPKKYGLVTTGNEVLYGRIQDTFTPVITEKMAEYGCEMTGHELSGDDSDRITQCIHRLLRGGAEMVICTGGMSVDPDDRTPLAIKNTGANILRSACAAGGNVPAVLYGGRQAGMRPARLRNVRQAHHIRHSAALPPCRCAGNGGYAGGPWQRRPLPQLPGVPLSQLRLWQVEITSAP